MKREVSPVGQWLIAECAARDMSYAEASRRAGVDKSTVSLIVRGTRPGVETCRAFARLFGVPVEKVLALAGHLGDSPLEAPLAPPVRLLTEELLTLPPAVQEPLIAAWRAMLDAAKAAKDFAGE